LERPDGVKIAAFFIRTIVITSMLSRVWRTTELRVGKIEIDSAAQRFLDEALVADHDGVVRIIANDPDAGDVAEYQTKHRAACEDHLIAADAPVIFLEIYIIDASEFSADLSVRVSKWGHTGFCALRAPQCQMRSPRSCSTCGITAAKSRMPISIGVKATHCSI
jgi:hypothetical protein